MCASMYVCMYRHTYVYTERWKWRTTKKETKGLRLATAALAEPGASEVDLVAGDGGFVRSAPKGDDPTNRSEALY